MAAPAPAPAARRGNNEPLNNLATWTIRPALQEFLDSVGLGLPVIGTVGDYHRLFSDAFELEANDEAAWANMHSCLQRGVINGLSYALMVFAIENIRPLRDQLIPAVVELPIELPLVSYHGITKRGPPVPRNLADDPKFRSYMDAWDDRIPLRGPLLPSTSAQSSSSSTGDNLVMSLPPRDGTLGASMDGTVEELVEGASTPTTASEIMGAKVVSEKREPQCNVYVRRAKRAKIQPVALQFGGDSGIYNNSTVEGERTEERLPSPHPSPAQPVPPPANEGQSDGESDGEQEELPPPPANRMKRPANEAAWANMHSCLQRGVINGLSYALMVFAIEHIRPLRDQLIPAVVELPIELPLMVIQHPYQRLPLAEYADSLRRACSVTYCLDFKNIAIHTPNICHRQYGFENIDPATVPDLPVVHGITKRGPPVPRNLADDPKFRSYMDAWDGRIPLRGPLLPSTSAQSSSSSTGDNLVMSLPPRDGTLGASTPTTASEIMGAKVVSEKREPQCNVYVRRAKRAKIQPVALQFGGDSGIYNNSTVEGERTEERLPSPHPSPAQPVPPPANEAAWANMHSCLQQGVINGLSYALMVIQHPYQRLPLAEYADSLRRACSVTYCLDFKNIAIHTPHICHRQYGFENIDPATVPDLPVVHGITKRGPPVPRNLADDPKFRSYMDAWDGRIPLRGPLLPSTSAQSSSSSTGDNLVMSLPPRDGTLGASMDETVEELVEGASTPTTASEIMGAKVVSEKREPQCNVYVRRAKRAKIQPVALQFGGDSGIYNNSTVEGERTEERLPSPHPSPAQPVPPPANEAAWANMHSCLQRGVINGLSYALMVFAIEHIRPLLLCGNTTTNGPTYHNILNELNETQVIQHPYQRLPLAEYADSLRRACSITYCLDFKNIAIHTPHICHRQYGFENIDPATVPDLPVVLGITKRGPPVPRNLADDPKFRSYMDAWDGRIPLRGPLLPD
ncbi:hypothetical protein ACLB2K_045215 [Fragaria x ananassa]